MLGYAFQIFPKLTSIHSSVIAFKMNAEKKPTPLACLFQTAVLLGTHAGQGKEISTKVILQNSLGIAEMVNHSQAIPHLKFIKHLSYCLKTAFY